VMKAAPTRGMPVPCAVHTVPSRFSNEPRKKIPRKI